MQRVRSTLCKTPLTQFVIATLCAAGTQVSYAQAAGAQTSGDLGSVQSTAVSSSGNSAAASRKVESAPAQAPSQGSLTATEPQSTISRRYIENSTAPTANYSDIANIAPSVQSVNPNGPGLMESAGVTIRGFQDGQYNVTFDGIPFGDTNDFTHHSTSFFTSQFLNGITVDRGPGDASQIGFATFGGLLGMQSKDPTMTPSASLIGSYGSYNTWLAGAEFNTGDVQQLGDARAMFGYTQSSSDGYLTGAAQRRQNVYFKLEKPLGDDTLLTLFATYSKIHQDVSYGTTAAQIAQFGPNYGLSSDPTSQAFSGYNFDLINTDFEYIGIQSKVAQWAIDNKLYTYGYYHNGFNGMDPNGETPNGTIYGANNVPGQEMNNNYRAWGDVLRAQRDLGPGTLELGTWLAYQTNFRNNFNVDDSLNFAFTSPNFAMNDNFLTWQPYIQYALKLPYGLTITPGVKYASFTRHLYSDMNQGSGTPVDFSHTWTKVLPSLQIHEQINPVWSAYAQYAQGFLAPNLNALYVNNPAISGQPSPEQTDNYQIGTTYKTDRVTASVDLYYVNFKNAVTNQTIGGVTFFQNAGGAIYKGVETEGTYYAGLGFSLYGNFTVNSAKQKGTNDWMPNSPRETAAFGVIYEHGPLTGSLITKFIGRQYGLTGNQIPIGGYAVTNLATGYTFKSPSPWFRDVRLGFQIDNLFNRTSIDWLAGQTVADGTPLYYTVPGRAFIGTMQMDF
ncbi:TonB-dependent receptor [Paraburkholderia fungorum]